jgi:hypothetical protein
MHQRAPTPTLEVLFRGADLAPELIPLRSIAETLSAVQRLASGRDIDETEPPPDNDAIGLLRVRRGSAVFQCVANNPTAALSNLKSVGQALTALETASTAVLDYALRPIETLSTIARSLACNIVIRKAQDRSLLATVDGDSYKHLSQNMLMSGETSVAGRVQRVGGATEMRCALRIEGRHRLLFCDVASREISRKLGQHLYEEVVAVGMAQWFQRSWKIFSFEIRDIYTPRPGSLVEAVRALHAAGGKAWDAIQDPMAYLKELRS